jgi:hypothetical protein
MTPAAAVARYCGKRFGCHLLSLAQERPGRGAVFHLKRQAINSCSPGSAVDRSSPSITQIPPRGAPDASRRHAHRTADREVADADGPDPTLREVAGRLPRDVHEVLDETLSPPRQGRLSRLEEDTLSQRPIPGGSNSSGSIEVGSWISITRARPIVASSGILSIPSRRARSGAARPCGCPCVTPARASRRWRRRRVLCRTPVRSEPTGCPASEPSRCAAGRRCRPVLLR